MTLTVADSRYDVTVVEDFETAPAARDPKYTWQRVTDFEQAPTGLRVPITAASWDDIRSWR